MADFSDIQEVQLPNIFSLPEEERLRIDRDRIEYWQGQGAQLSERVAKLLKASAAA